MTDEMRFETPAELFRCLKLGREEFCQRDRVMSEMSRRGHGGPTGRKGTLGAVRAEPEDKEATNQ